MIYFVVKIKGAGEDFLSRHWRFRMSVMPRRNV